MQHGLSSLCDGLYRYAPPISGTFSPGGGGGGGTPLHGLYGDVPLDRVWFSKIFKMSAKPQQQTNECRVSCRPGSVQLNL